MKKINRYYNKDMINITVPESWLEMSQDNLRTLLMLISNPDIEAAHIPVLFVLKTAKIKVLKFDSHHGSAVVRIDKTYLEIESQELAALTCKFSWLLDFPEYPLRLGRIKRAIARRPDLADFTFSEYIVLDNLYQGYLQTKDLELLHNMVPVMYGKGKPNKIGACSCFFWFTSFKIWAAKRWSEFFQPAKEKQSFSSLSSLIRDAIDSQIRALTKGDITKEDQILNMPLHRALTELNALARESRELKQKLKK